MSMQMAKEAVERVWKRWGGWIPQDLRKHKAEDIFVFHHERRTFDLQFNIAYFGTFKKSCDLKFQGFEVGDSLGGFVTAIKEHSKRKVHFLQDNFNKEYEKDSLLC